MRCFVDLELPSPSNNSARSPFAPVDDLRRQLIQTTMLAALRCSKRSECRRC
jgi:hypothetical protein